MNTKDADLDALARDLAAAAGRPLVTLAEAARLCGLSLGTLRTGLYTGALTASRRVANGPVRIWCRDLAAWLFARKRHSLPGRRERE
ncbi:MAG: hypothetical protein HY720_01090 [Planctomycetes bacterium]|nr:hypothetical protein [Planctomycetota bacterium]